MKRLEYERKVRGARTHAKNATEAVTLLANFARERNRLEQERKSLQHRLRRIDARLTAITGTETRLYPTITQAAARAAAAPIAGTAAAVRVPVRPTGVAEVTLQY